MWILVSIFIWICQKTEAVICPINGMHTLPNIDHCNSYYLCVSGIPILLHCGPGTNFDTNLLACTINATCNRCDGNPAGNVIYYPSEEECDVYTVCTGSVETEGKCFQGLHFNPKTNECDFPNNAKCLQFIESEITNCPHTFGFQTLANSDYCDQYSICIDGLEWPRKCNPGLVYDIRSRSCEIQSRGKCIRDDFVKCPEKTGVQRYPHPYDCHFYFMCIDSIPLLRLCAPDLLFDSLMNKCNMRPTAICTPGAIY